MQQLTYSEYFVNELGLTQLISSEQVSMIYIHGTVRSDSKIVKINSYWQNTGNKIHE